jgi:NADH-quinone oxidoreductase subunit N
MSETVSETAFSWASLAPLSPEIFLAVSALLFIIWGVMRGNDGTRDLCVLGILVSAAAFYLVFRHNTENTVVSMNGQFSVSIFSNFMKMLVLAGMALTFMLASSATRHVEMKRFEYPILVLLSVIGMMLMLSANDLLTLYLGLELQSLSLYVLAAFRRDSTKSAEAGLKYFVLGALSSGLILFGMSLIYGFGGSIQYTALAQSVLDATTANHGLQLGLILVMSGLAFKVSAVPFHMWTPDVYDGAPTITTGFFAMVPKIAALGAMTNLLWGPFAPLSAAWGQVIMLLAVSSIVWAAFAGLNQTNLKRLLAYSTIGNIGFALLGLLPADGAGLSSMVIYMAIYMVMNAGTFGIILALKKDDGTTVEKIDDLAGLSKTRPGLAYAMAALMFSLSGIPPLAGFISKLLIINAVVEAGLHGIAVVAVLGSVVATYYYLKIIKVMFFDAPVVNFTICNDALRRAAVAISITAVVVLLAAPGWLLIAANNATTIFR